MFTGLKHLSKVFCNSMRWVAPVLPKHCKQSYGICDRVRTLTTSTAYSGPGHTLENKVGNARKALNEDQVRQYQEDGYIVVENLLNDEEVALVRDGMNDFKEWSRKISKTDGTYDLGPDHTAKNPQLRRIVCPSLHHSTFWNLLRNPKILDVVEDLIGPNIRYIAQEKLNLKPPGRGTGIPWHQDWAFFPFTNDSVLTVSVIVDDSDRENGSLQVIPKSHQGPIVSHFMNGEFMDFITDSDFHPTDVKYLEAPAGSITVHHVRLIHGSATNTSHRPRRVYCMIFCAMDAWPLLGIGGSDFKNVGPVSYELFDATRVRGQPCMQPRLKDVPVWLPVPFEKDSTVYNDKSSQRIPDK